MVNEKEREFYYVLSLHHRTFISHNKRLGESYRKGPNLSIEKRVRQSLDPAHKRRLLAVCQVTTTGAIVWLQLAASGRKVIAKGSFCSFNHDLLLLSKWKGQNCSDCFHLSVTFSHWQQVEFFPDTFTQVIQQFFSLNLLGQWFLQYIIMSSAAVLLFFSGTVIISLWKQHKFLQFQFWNG